MTALRPSNLRALRLEWVDLGRSLIPKADTHRSVRYAEDLPAGVGQNPPYGDVADSSRSMALSTLSRRSTIEVSDAGRLPASLHLRSNHHLTAGAHEK